MPRLDGIPDFMIGDPYAIGYDPAAHRERVTTGTTTLEVGALYSEAQRQGVSLPHGYRWSSMTYGLDETGKGVRRALEKATPQSGSGWGE